MIGQLLLYLVNRIGRTRHQPAIDRMQRSGYSPRTLVSRKDQYNIAKEDRFVLRSITSNGQQLWVQYDDGRHRLAVSVKTLRIAQYVVNNVMPTLERVL